MITLRQVRKAFGDQVVLDKLDLEVPRGKITAIVGPSGGGKSVLLKHMIGLLKPDSGQVLVDGENIVSMDRGELNRVREKFGVLFQSAALFDSMTIFENVAFPLEEKTRFSREEIRNRVHRALEEVGLRSVDDKYPDQLSGGMKKRVGLARALLLDPAIILFDEPTTGLDPIICKAMHRLILDTHAQFGFTAVIVTHEVPAIFEICDYVAMLYQGKILFRGTPDEIRASDDPAVRQFILGELEGPLQLL
ncbi:MAG: ABC transporter ATP-binding protein [Deltaproteobacteria bacterium]|nr:ABC transporter ATP-binding protein [Deltaproteobacteria bacterium]